MYDFDDKAGEYNVSDENVDEVLEEIEEQESEEVDEAQEEKPSSIRDRAMTRVEEANLFMTLINQSIFAPNSARPEILRAVNSKIQKFAINQLEVLLGMKQPEAVAQVAVAKSPFNDGEIKVLKVLIAKVLKATPELSADVPATPAERKAELIPIQAKAPQIQQIKAQPQQQQAVPVQKTKPASKRRKPKSEGGDLGFSRPNSKTAIKPMPTAAQAMAAMGVANTEAIVSGVDVSSQAVQNGAKLMKNVISQLTGGHQVAVDNSNPADAALNGGGSEDVNGRF